MKFYIDRWADQIAAVIAADESAALLSTAELAKFLRISEQFLATARCRGEGPPWVRIGRSIRYQKTDVVRWLNERTYQNTSGYARRGAS